jgi:hypothetical protein
VVEHYSVHVSSMFCWSDFGERRADEITILEIEPVQLITGLLRVHDIFEDYERGSFCCIGDALPNLSWGGVSTDRLKKYRNGHETHRMAPNFPKSSNRSVFPSVLSVDTQPYEAGHTCGANVVREILNEERSVDFWGEFSSTSTHNLANFFRKGLLFGGEEDRECAVDVGCSGGGVAVDLISRKRQSGDGLGLSRNEVFTY